MTEILIPNLILSLALLGDGTPPADPPWAPRIARVVDGATHAPVAGVDVWWLDPEELSGEDATLVRERNLVPEEWIRRLGHRGVSDVAGDVALPIHRDGRIVVVWHDGKFARAEEASRLDRSRVVALELEDDPGQRVRVVDGAGAPLHGVAVAAWCEERGICGNCGPNNDHVWSAPTDERGEVVLPHAAWYFRNSDSNGNLGDRVHLVGLGFPTEKSNWVGREAMRGNPPEIELVAPPLEPLAFDLLLESGERCGRAIEVTLAPGAPKADSFLGTGRPFGSWTARDGRFVLPHVERGLLWRVASAYDDASGAIWYESAISASDPSPTATPRTARACEHYVRVRGRAIDASKQPITDREVGADWAPQNATEDDARPIVPYDARSPIDAEGRFALDFLPSDIRMRGQLGHHVLRLFVMPRRRRFSYGDGVPVRVEIKSDGDVPEVDVGDVVLSRPFSAISGRVVDRTGRPVPGATLVVVDGKPAPDSFRTESFFVDADDDGRFELEGAPAQGPLTLAGREFGWRLDGLRLPSVDGVQPATTRIAIGTRDVEVVLSPLGGMRGRVVFAEGMRARDVVLSTVNPGSELLDFYPDGVFEIRGDAHRVDVQCRARKDDSFLGISSPVVLPEEGMEDAPELLIDLTRPRRTR